MPHCHSPHRSLASEALLSLAIPRPIEALAETLGVGPQTVRRLADSLVSDGVARRLMVGRKAFYALPGVDDTTIQSAADAYVSPLATKVLTKLFVPMPLADLVPWIGDVSEKRLVRTLNALVARGQIMCWREAGSPQLYGLINTTETAFRACADTLERSSSPSAVARLDGAPCTVATLAARLGISRQGAHVALQKLEERGLARRFVAPETCAVFYLERGVTPPPGSIPMSGVATRREAVDRHVIAAMSLPIACSDLAVATSIPETALRPILRRLVHSGLATAGTRDGVEAFAAVGSIGAAEVAPPSLTSTGRPRKRGGLAERTLATLANPLSRSALQEALGVSGVQQMNTVLKSLLDTGDIVRFRRGWDVRYLRSDLSIATFPELADMAPYPARRAGELTEAARAVLASAPRTARELATALGLTASHASQLARHLVALGQAVKAACQDGRSRYILASGTKGGACATLAA